jgi:hypothetical protein
MESSDSEDYVTIDICLFLSMPLLMFPTPSLYLRTMRETQECRNKDFSC